MRNHKSSKSNICTEGAGVYVAGMNTELSVHYSGSSVALSTKRLLASRGAEKKQQKSADDIVGRIDPSEGQNIIQQAISDVLNPIFDPHFSENSYRFRAGKSAKQAVRKAISTRKQSRG